MEAKQYLFVGKTIRVIHFKGHGGTDLADGGGFYGAGIADRDGRDYHHGGMRFATSDEAQAWLDKTAGESGWEENTSLTAEDLGACPFCGSPGHLIASIDLGGYSMACSAAGECPAHVQTHWCERRSDAIASWNKRAWARG